MPPGAGEDQAARSLPSLLKEERQARGSLHLQRARGGEREMGWDRGP